MLISDSRFDLVWFRLSCDHGWIRSGSVNVRKQQLSGRVSSLLNNIAGYNGPHAPVVRHLVTSKPSDVGTRVRISVQKKMKRFFFPKIFFTPPTPKFPRKKRSDGVIKNMKND